MLWVTWRHHRTQIAACACLVAAASLLPFALGASMHTAWSAGPSGCLTVTAGSECSGVLAGFQTRFAGSLEQLLGWLNLLPPLIGAFIGAPLLAREFESGTWRLAFTQAVPRTRWLTTKIVLLATVIVTLMTVFIAVFSWYRGPLDLLEGRFGPNSYDFEGLSLPALALLAFAIGVLAGMLLRRTLAAMAVTIGAFLVVRPPVETWLRPRLQVPLLVTGQSAEPGSIPRTDWVLSSGLTGPGGVRLSDQAEAQAMHAAQAAGESSEYYLRTRGYGHWALLEPASRFWHVQILEDSVYAALALCCLTAAVLVLRREHR
jgi:hypothetical protein